MNDNKERMKELDEKRRKIIEDMDDIIDEMQNPQHCLETMRFLADRLFILKSEKNTRWKQWSRLFMLENTMLS